MEGSAKIISLISRDENQHVVVTQQILNKWNEGDDPEMKLIAEQERDNTIRMFKKTVDEEKAWAEYLFKDGSMIGLNEKLLNQYVEWIANRRLTALPNHGHRHPPDRQFRRPCADHSGWPRGDLHPLLSPRCPLIPGSKDEALTEDRLPPSTESPVGPSPGRCHW